jgi:dephospho-CoA kinase
MAPKPGKYIIGLTGNIATGKSLIRKMLEQTGAFGIDADSLAHYAIKQGSSGYKSVVEEFGDRILTSRGEIDRAKLGGIVFSEPQSLKKLEKVIHPLVREKIHELIEATPFSHIVIEAIKLFESGLSSECNTIWVSDSSEEQQIERLISQRGLDRSSALARIHAQSPQSQKNKMADRVIKNDGTYLQTWKQVRQAWSEILLESRIQLSPTNPADFNGIEIYRCNPDDMDRIKKLMSRFNNGIEGRSASDFSDTLSKNQYLVVSEHNSEKARIAWYIDNFTICATDFYLNAAKPTSGVLYNIIKELDRFWLQYRPERILIFIPIKFIENTRRLQLLGYEKFYPGDEVLGNGESFSIADCNNNIFILSKKLDMMSTPL